ncbi:hypothetical protein TNCV_2479181 [Trichonephila clavipes]|nr:hypothetical protein TNCV_2479181 [Trichonephila clavipes]
MSGRPNLAPLQVWKKTELLTDACKQGLKETQEEDDNIQTLKSLLEKQESEEFLSEMVYSISGLNGRELIVTPKAMQAELIKLIHENGHSQ